MTPIIEINDDDLKTFNRLGLKYKIRKDLQSNVKQVAEIEKSDWIVIPREFTGGRYKVSVNPARLSYSPAVEKVASELGLKLQDTAKDSLGRNYIGKISWFDSLKANLLLGDSTLTLEEFNDFGRLLYKGMHEKIKVYNVSGKQLDSKFLEQVFYDITQVRNPWRAEWLDADFKVKGKDLYINYNHVLGADGNLIPRNSELLNRNTLMQDRTPGISLENWLDSSHTKQGLPSKKVKSGKLSSWYPRSDNNSVAGFNADSDWANLFCSSYPSGRDSGLGVRAAKQRE